MINRRDFLFGTLGVALGGAVASTTGMGVYYWRRAREGYVAFESARVPGIEQWILNQADHDDLARRTAAPESQHIEILDDVDIPGAGDFRDLQVSGVDDCLTACANDDQCNAFTFARLSHPVDHKRHMCWLKSERNPERLVASPHYVSGRRP